MTAGQMCNVMLEGNPKLGDLELNPRLRSRVVGKVSEFKDLKFKFKIGIWG